VTIRGGQSIPVQVQTAFEKQTEAESGAFLYCEQFMSKWVDINVRALRKWGKSNGKFILSQYPRAEEHGFMVITAIHVAKLCELKCWHNEEGSYKGDIAVGAFGNAITPQVGGHGRRSEANCSRVTRPTDDDRVLVQISQKQVVISRAWIGIMLSSSRV